MADIPYKFYKYSVNGRTYYDLLPSYNTPSGYTPVSDPAEVQTATQWYQNFFNSNDFTGSRAEADNAFKRLSDYQAGQTQFATNDAGVIASKDEIAAQQTLQEQLASGNYINTGTAEAPLLTPKDSAGAVNLAGGSFAEQVNTPTASLPGVNPVDPGAAVPSIGQPATGLGSTAETNRLLGGTYFDPITGSQVAPFTASPQTIQDAGGVGTPAPLPPQTPVTTDVPTTGITPPTLPEPTATATSTAYLTSVSSQVETLQKQLEDTYKKQITDLQTQIDSSQAKIDQLSATEKGIIEGPVQDLTSPFRESLEMAERKRLYIEENFEANQKLVNELGTLLSDGNALVEQMKGVTGLASIRNPRINQAIDGINARVGVINAVMAARNNQISQAYTLIDRSVSAITADRNDRLSYYNTLLNFYESAKGDEGKKLVTLKADQKEFLDAQIGMVKDSLANAQTTANYIKGLMVSPESALFMAQAGVTLNDSIATINAKLATQTQRQQVIDVRNEYISNGYTPVAMPGTDTITIQAGGQNLYFKALAKAPIEVSPGASLIDPITGKVISTAPKSYAPSSGGSSGSSTGSGSTAPNLSITQKADFAEDIGVLSEQTDRTSALALLSKNQTALTTKYGKYYYDLMVKEVDKLFPATTSTAPMSVNPAATQPIQQPSSNIVTDTVNAVGGFFSGIYNSLFGK